jgi:ATP-dependent helicase/nuclease subunit B
MRLFIKEVGAAWPPDAPERLREALRRALRRAYVEAYVRPALYAWWEPRLDRIAEWVAETELTRRLEGAPVDIGAELLGSLDIERPGRRFTLRARADRIERRADGTLTILDYKTGGTPSEIDVKRGRAPQLPLEAAIAAAGGFGVALRGETSELIYWKLGGGIDRGEAKSLFTRNQAALREAVAETLDGLGSLIDQYDEPDRCYLAQPHPGRLPRFSDYAQLARVAEWPAGPEEERA